MQVLRLMKASKEVELAAGVTVKLQAWTKMQPNSKAMSHFVVPIGEFKQLDPTGRG